VTQFDYYIHDESDAVRIEITGPLSGPHVMSLDQAWQTVCSVLNGRNLVIDLVSVEDADQDGRDLLLAWHRVGARIITRSLESRLLVEGILGVRVAMPAATQGWRQRLKHYLRGSTTAASKRAEVTKHSTGLLAAKDVTL